MIAAFAESPTHAMVDEKVRDLLSKSAAYQSLSEDQQRTLAADMSKVAKFIVGGPNGDSVPRAAQLVGSPAATRALADEPYDPAGSTASRRMAAAGGAVAAQAGSAAFTGMIQAVNFPAFVSGLIDGVFNAIVTASIKQMEAYQKLVANVAKSVDEYMKDNVTENSARDYLAGRYPQHLEIDTSGDKPVIKVKQGADDSDVPDFAGDLGLREKVSSLDDETAEQVLMPGARRRMAMDRQQLLATMVLMGINRLVVTDGSIEANCTFSLDTRDRVARHFDTASQYDYHQDYSESGGGWFSPDTSYNQSANFTVSTHQSEDSEAKVDLHAKLGGKVRVNFKSETYPLDKMGDLIQPKPPRPAATPPAPASTGPASAATPPAAATPAAPGR